MPPGSRRFKAKILGPPDYTETDVQGQPMDNWPLVDERWVNVRDLARSRLYQAQQVHPETRAEVDMAYNTTVKEGMRIQIGDRILEIIGHPADPDGRRRDLVCTCREIKEIEAEILKYIFKADDNPLGEDVEGTIDAQNKKVSLTVPAGADVTSLVATYELSTGATAKVDDESQVSGETENDFTEPVIYTITGHGIKEWTVEVEVAE